MKINWGTKIAILYTGFVAMMIILVIASTRQKFDLVSNDYYKQELTYQKVIDATANQASLSSAAIVDDSGTDIMISFPPEFANKPKTGTVEFYAPANAGFDKQFSVTGKDNRMVIKRKKLDKTAYKVKLSYTVGGKSYYQESDINLN